MGGAVRRTLFDARRKKGLKKWRLRFARDNGGFDFREPRFFEHALEFNFLDQSERWIHGVGFNPKSAPPAFASMQRNPSGGLLWQAFFAPLFCVTM